jgi:hypothetical protein
LIGSAVIDESDEDWFCPKALFQEIARLLAIRRAVMIA